MKKSMSLAAICLALTTSLSVLTAQEVAKVSQALPFATKGQVDLSQAAPAVSSPQTTDTTDTTPPVLTGITAGGRIRTDAGGSASVALSGVGTVQMERNTEIKIPDEPDAKHSLELLKGKLFLHINAEDLQKHQAGEFRLKTPTALLAVKGTRFFVDCEKKSDIIGLQEGSLSVLEYDSQSTVLLLPDQAVTVSAGSISAPRPLTDKEKKITSSTLEDIGTVITSLLVETWVDKGGPLIFWQGKVGPRVSSSRGTVGFLMTDLEHVVFEDRSKSKSPDQLLGDGTVVMTTPYDYQDAKKGTTSKTVAAALENYQLMRTSAMHFKGEAWRAKKAGLPQIGTLIGMQARLRLKNVAKFSCFISDGSYFQKLPEGAVNFSAPPGLAPDASWEKSCIIPCTVSKTGENSGYRFFLMMHPEGPLDAAGKLRQGTATVSIDGISLISRSR